MINGPIEVINRRFFLFYKKSNRKFYSLFQIFTEFSVLCGCLFVGFSQANCRSKMVRYFLCFYCGVDFIQII